MDDHGLVPSKGNIFLLQDFLNGLGGRVAVCFEGSEVLSQG